LTHKSECVTNRRIEVLKPVRSCSGIAPGGLTTPPGDSLSERVCTERRLAARCAPPGGDVKTVGSGRELAPGGGQVPPGGLGLFRQAVLTGAPGDRAPGHEWCVLF